MRAARKKTMADQKKKNWVYFLSLLLLILTGETSTMPHRIAFIFGLGLINRDQLAGFEEPGVCCKGPPPSTQPCFSNSSASSHLSIP